MQRWESVTIVGVGLIGASIGLALRERELANSVVGVGRRTSSLTKAKRCGAITSATTDLSRGVRDAQLVVVCTPVEMIARFAIEASQACQKDSLITDAGSTKLSVVEAVDAALKGKPGASEFVGSHPMAGSEKTGPENATADLFEGRVAIVTPTTSSNATAVSQIEQFWKSLGAKVTSMSPKEHDKAVAAISHMPHLVASAMAASTPEADLQLASTGWLDTTRIASGDPDLWRQIFTENRAGVLKSLDKFERVLTSFRTALEQEDYNKLLELLEAGKQRRDTLGN